MNSGFLLIDKPEGPTSHDVVDALRRILGIRRIGHAGTLDPFAAGLLILGVGKSTRLLNHLAKKDKTYRFKLMLGFTTDTYDRTGDIKPWKDSSPKECVSREKIEEILRNFKGHIRQIPPSYSSIKIKGKKLYEYARKGIKIEGTPREVTVYRLTLLSYEYPFLFLEAQVSTGTYIRSLGYDIGQRLGVGAYVHSLRRTAIGAFRVEESPILDPEKSTWKDLEKGWRYTKEIFSEWESIRVSGNEQSRLEKGQAILYNNPVFHSKEQEDSHVLVLDSKGEEFCLAILKRKDKEFILQPKIQLTEHPRGKNSG